MGVVDSYQGVCVGVCVCVCGGGGGGGGGGRRCVLSQGLLFLLVLLSFVLSYPLSLFYLLAFYYLLPLSPVSVTMSYWGIEIVSVM